MVNVPPKGRENKDCWQTNISNEQFKICFKISLQMLYEEMKALHFLSRTDVLECREEV